MTEYLAKSAEEWAAIVVENAAEIDRLMDKAAGAETWREQARALADDVDSLRLERDGLERTRQRDNEYLIGQRDEARAALSRLVDLYRDDNGHVIVKAGASPADDALLAALDVLGRGT